MMTHDPFQNYQTLGAYPGGATPYGLPYTPLQSPFNPLAQTGFNPFAQASFNPLAQTGQPFVNPSIGGSGIYPQQLQGGAFPGHHGLLQQLLALNAIAASQQNPLLQNPFAQNPWQQNPWQQNPWQQNPLLGASLQNPLLNPMLAYHGWPQQQQQFNYPLAPQSLIGAGGGQPFGQINPLAQFAQRQPIGYGIPPLAGYF